jgi:PAS domain S-box-containing protein
MLQFADSLLRCAGAGLIALDVDFRVIFWNEPMEMITGLGAEEATGRQAIEVFPFLRDHEENMRRALAGETIAVRRSPFSLAGRAGFLDGYFTHLTDEGETSGVACVINDLTAQKAAEEQLGETESRFQNMADAAPVLLWMSEPDGLCTFFNQSWLDFTGRTMEEEWGVGWAEGIHFEDFQKCMDTYFASFNARRVFEMEYRLRRRDGAYRWLLDRGTPRYTPDGVFAGYIGSCIDITDRKNMEGELRKAVRDRDDFLSIASHELRTPLTTLSLEIQSLKRGLDKRLKTTFKNGGRLERSADVAEGQVNRLITLVEELLDVSRLASGRLRVEPTEFDLSDLVREVASRLKPSLDAAGCALSVEARARTVGSWDRLRVEQVVANLVSNALKYGPGSPVEMSVTRETECVCLRVRDHGIGIAPADQRRIFQRFERAVPLSHYSGFGLGLWIAREIVAAHGGSIDVDSELGRGSTFTVRLPFRAA